MTERFPTSYEKLVALADGTKYEQVANDRAELERLFIEAMRTSTDPMTKEIGSGLADGSLTWRTVGTSSAYSDYVERSLDAMQTFDFGAVVDEMEQEKAAATRAARQQDEKNEDEDPDELWQGFNRGHS